MRWMQGVKNGDDINMLLAIGALEIADPTQSEPCVLPDLHAAMWRNYDLQVDFLSNEMQIFAQQHADFLEEYKQYLKGRCAKALKSWTEDEELVIDEEMLESPQKKAKKDEDAESVESDWGNPEHAAWSKDLKRHAGDAWMKLGSTLEQGLEDWWSADKMDVETTLKRMDVKTPLEKKTD